LGNALPYPLGKQRHCLLLAEGAEAEHKLPGDAERFLAGRQHPEVGAGDEQSFDEAGRGGKDMLAVVDEKKCALSPQLPGHRIGGVATGVHDEAQGSRRGLGDAGRVRHGGQVAEPGAARVAVRRVGGQLDGKSSLA